jgi:xylose isomerase
LSDGHDYAFHIHFGSAWERMVEVVKAAAGYRPEIALHLEYKPWETRSQNLLNSAAKTVLLCEAAGRDGLGVTVDIGHSTFGGETPAQSLMLVAACGYPYYVHTNDNNGRADWDLVAGSCNLWEYAEFLFYLKELGYEGWITSDVAPVRQDPAEIFALNARVTQRIWEWLDEVDREEIRQRLHRHDYMSVRKLMEPYLFPRLGSSTGVAAR